MADDLLRSVTKDGVTITTDMLRGPSGQDGLGQAWAGGFPVGGQTGVTRNGRFWSRVVVGAVTGATKVLLGVTAQFGNLGVALYRNGGDGLNAAPSGPVIATTGIVPCPPVGAAEIPLLAPADVAVGDWALIVIDNTTAAVWGNSTSSGQPISAPFARSTAGVSIPDPAPTTPGGGNRASTYIGFSR